MQVRRKTIISISYDKLTGMRFSKTAFLCLLLIVLLSPLIIYNTVWITRARKATGTMCFQGKTLNGQFSTEYPVIKFSSNGRDTVFFNGAETIAYKAGLQVPVLFPAQYPAEAKVASFAGLWLGPLLYLVVPLVLLLIVYLHPGIIPRHAVIVIGKRPFIHLEKNDWEL